MYENLSISSHLISLMSKAEQGYGYHVSFPTPYSMNHEKSYFSKS